jgi:citrate lyase subunit beta/citryl-CoA lyase
MAGRSYLFVPGDRPDRFEKAWNAGADAVILDLEDAVTSESKTKAREAVAAWLSPEHPVYVRVNGTATEWFQADLQAVAKPGLAGIVLPKAEDVRQIAGIAARIGEEASVIPILETALGVWSAREVAEAPRVERLAFGSIDFQLDAGIDGENEELLYARSRLVLASRIAGILPPLDGVTVALDDVERLADDIERARRLGFGGKLCVHPKQVETVNRGFMPAETEIAWARRVLAAAEAAKSGAVRLGGEMIDRPVIERAKAILARAGG